MYLTTAASLALLPVLTMAQINETIFGGYPSYDSVLQYYRAIQNTNITNAVSFPGYNWTIPITSMSGPSTNSSNAWQMHLNYSQVTVPTRSGNATTGLTTLAMTFPEREWDVNSDWSLCATIGTLMLTTSGNNSDSSCVSYLGQSCTSALLRELRSAPVGGSCPFFPALSTIPECSSVANSIGSSGSAVITNTTSPDLVYNSTAYVNVTGGSQTYLMSNVPYQGLSSGQAFAGFLSVFPSGGNLDVQSNVEAETIRMVALAITPSSAFRRNTTGGYGWQPNLRLICARAKTSGALTSIKQVPVGVILSLAAAVASLLVV